MSRCRSNRPRLRPPCRGCIAKRLPKCSPGTAGSRGRSAAGCRSVLNENYRVPSSGGDLFIRFHRKSRSRESLEVEASVTAWAGGHGIPVVAPLADNQGRELHVISNRFSSVYPWVDGATSNGHHHRRQARVLGTCRAESTWRCAISPIAACQAARPGAFGTRTRRSTPSAGWTT